MALDDTWRDQHDGLGVGVGQLAAREQPAERRDPAEDRDAAAGLRLGVLDQATDEDRLAAVHQELRGDLGRRL